MTQEYGSLEAGDSTPFVGEMVDTADSSRTSKRGLVAVGLLLVVAGVAGVSAGGRATPQTAKLWDINNDDDDCAVKTAWGCNGTASYPTNKPTDEPSAKPTPKPTPVPSVKPTFHPSAKPTQHPSPKPTPHPSAKPNPYPTESSLIAHFDFSDCDETTITSSDGEWTCTEQGSVSCTNDAEGNSDSAAYLGGTGYYYCEGTELTSTTSGTDERTYCMWAKILEYNEGGLWDAGSYSDCEEFSLRTTDTAMRVQNWGSSCDWDSSNSIDGSWAHYCLSFDGTTSYLYIDGSLDSSMETALDTTNTRLDIGTYYNGENIFNGDIDEFRIYSECLSASEISDLYNEVDTS